MVSPQKPRPQEASELTWGRPSLETALRTGVGLRSALRLRWGSKVGRARWGDVWDASSPPVGLREAGCDLIFLMVLSLVLLGCGGPSPPPHQNGVCWGIEST